MLFAKAVCVAVVALVCTCSTSGQTMRRDGEERRPDPKDLAASLRRAGTFAVTMSPAIHDRVLLLKDTLKKQDEKLRKIRGTVAQPENGVWESHSQDASLLEECRPNGQEIPWEDRHQLVGYVFMDGLGHSLSTYLHQLYTASMYGCRSTLPQRYSVHRNFVFLPWHERTGPDNTPKKSPQQRLEDAATYIHQMKWLREEPTRFLYCHRKREGISKEGLLALQNEAEFFASEDFRTSMSCYTLDVDPWRSFCDVATGGHCETELEILGGNIDDAKADRRQLRGGGTGHKPKFIHLDNFAGSPVLPKGMLKHVQRQLPGVPSPQDPRTREAIKLTIDRLRKGYWDSVQTTRADNQRRSYARQHYQAAQLDALSDCGYKDDVLDVAIHMRRGDLFGSGAGRDQERYTSMEYYRAFLSNLTAAYEASPKLKAAFPQLKFHVHSESQTLPPPLGHQESLPEFDGVKFHSPEAYGNFSDGHPQWSSVVCPRGNLEDAHGRNHELNWCLNVNPLQAVQCMAKADVFLAAESFFSTLIVVTSDSLKVVPNTDKFLDTYLCQRMGVCGLWEEDPSMLLDTDLTAQVLENHLLARVKPKPE